MATSITLALAGLGATAQAAGANVLTVDDDGVQCPSADHTSVVAAVAAASQGDDVRICDGTYTVPGGPGAAGLKIEKNVDLIGAGADKVVIQPDGTSPSMAAAVPNERDEFGNVITVKRRTVELADIEISGLTVRGNGTAAEAGIAMIDVNESAIHDVRVTGIAPDTGPGTGLFAVAPLAGSGHGIVVANTIEQTVNETTIDRVAVEGFNKAGIVVDSRVLDGTAERTNTMKATISDSSITGAGTSPLVAQDGIEGWGKSATVILDRNLITGVAAPGAQSGPLLPIGQAAAVYLRGVDPASTIGGSRANANTISGNAFGAYAGTFDGTTFATPYINAISNYWGSSNGPSTPPTKSAGDFAGAGSPTFGGGITSAPFLGTAPTPPVTPGPAADTAPLARFDTLTDGARTTVGTAVPLDVVATDDFGVRQVEYFVDGVALGTVPAFPYERDWVPGAADDAQVHRVTAVVTDSAGQTVELAASVQVGELPVTAPPTPDTPSTPAAPGVPAVPAPPAAPAPTRPSVRKPVVSRNAIRASRSRKAKVRIRCGATKGSSSCKGTVTLKSGTRTLGTRAFTIRAGRTTTVTVTLRRSAYALLRRRGSLRTSVTVRARDRDGTLRTGSARVTLRQPTR